MTCEHAATSRRRLVSGASVVLGVMLACSDDRTTGLANALLDASDIVITALDPDTVTVDTTVTVRITGSGFTEDATVSWLLDTTETTEIRTRATQWDSPTAMAVVIDVSPDAPLRSYSVRIRGGKKGKQGIAVEKFRVVAKPTALPEPGNASAALDINDSGIIVGHATDATGTTVAVRWTPADTGWTYTVAGQGSASAINNDGLFVRIYFDALARTYRSWIHFPSGAVADRGSAYVHDVGDDGTLIGWIEDASRKAIAVTWKKVSAESWGEPQALPLLPGFSRAFAMDINAAGDVLGTMSTSSESVGVVWRYRDGQWQLPVIIDASIKSGANAMNDHGALAGWILPCISGLPNCYSSPVRWASAGGQRTRLPTLYNSQAFAHDINNAGYVVGEAPVHYSDGTNVFAPLVWHAVIWFPGSQWPEDLGAIRPSYYGTAVAINKHGWAVGTMSDNTPFDRHATVWKLPASPIAGTPPAVRR